MKLRHSNKFVYIKPNQQASNNTINIPNLGGTDRNMMFTSSDQTIRDTQTFQEPITCNKQPTQNSHLTRKDYVDNKLNTKVAKNQIMSGNAEADKLVKYIPDKGIITPKLYFKDEFNDSVIIKVDDQDFDDMPLYIPNLKNYDGNDSRRKSEISVTSTDQIITGKKTFQKSIICNEQPTQNSHLTRKDYVDSRISNGGNFLKTDGTNFMTGELNMNEQKVKNMVYPTDEQDAVNKRYLESQLHDYARTDGQNRMTFDLNMNRYKIINLRDTTGLSFSSEAVNKKYVDDEVAKIPSVDTSTFLKKDGTVAMTGNLNMNNNRLINLNDPNNDTDTANKRYIDDEIKKASKKSSHTQENEFLYLMPDIDQTSTEYGMIVDGYANYEQSFHSNKKVISFKANLSGSSYRYRIGFQLGLIQVDQNYTMAIEQLFTNQTYWNKAEITINGTGISLHFIHTQKYQYAINNTNYYYIKTIVQLRKLTAPSHFIYYTTHIDNVSNPPNQISLNLVAYGARGSFNNVDESVYNEVLFKLVNDRIQPQKDIDMNNRKIINIPDGINEKDPVNKGQMESQIAFAGGKLHEYHLYTDGNPFNYLKIGNTHNHFFFMKAGSVLKNLK